MEFYFSSPTQMDYDNQFGEGRKKSHQSLLNSLHRSLQLLGQRSKYCCSPKPVPGGSATFPTGNSTMPEILPPRATVYFLFV